MIALRKQVRVNIQKTLTKECITDDLGKSIPTEGKDLEQRQTSLYNTPLKQGRGQQILRSP